MVRASKELFFFSRGSNLEAVMGSLLDYGRINGYLETNVKVERLGNEGQNRDACMYMSYIF